MSVQLVLFPQNYKGVYTATTNVTQLQYVADNVNFLTVMSHAGYSVLTTNVVSETLNNDPAIASWKRFRTTATSGYSLVDLPISSNTNKLEIYSSSTGSYSGVYQEIQGLTVGVQYDLSFNITQAGTGFIFIGGAYQTLNSGIYTLEAQTFNPAFAATLGTQTDTFIADATEEILVFAYASDGDTIYVDDISIKESNSQPTLIYSDLDDGQVICDQYEDEDIPLTLSIDDFKNVAEKVQSYSKDFDLPATKRNNKIFTHLFDITRINDATSFNPYVTTKCLLKQDGYTLFDGFLRLISINNKDGETSYNVNLFSEVIALADALKDKTFASLSLGELTHDYNKSNIKASWTSGLTLSNPLGANSFAGATGATTTDVIKYPFVDWTGGISISQSGNLGSGSGPIDARPELNKLEDAFRPFINCKYLLDNIFNDAGFTYTSVFLNTDKFTKLFMDFNFTGETPSTTMLGYYGFQSGGSLTMSSTTYKNVGPFNYNNFTNDVGWNQAGSRWIGQTSNVGYRIDYYILFKCLIASPLTYRIVKKNSANTIIDVPLVGSFTGSVGNVTVWQDSLWITLNQGDKLEFQFKSSTNNAYSLFQNAGQGSTFNVTIGLTTTVNGTLLNTRRGELGQWDYFKGLITMFNLITRKDPQNPNNILIEPYADVFINHKKSGVITDLSLASRGVKYDWTDKIDISQIDLKPLELIKDTVFKYEEDDDDYAFRIYKGGTGGKLYGERKFTKSTFTILSGEEIIEATPFAATVVKPLFSLYPKLLVPSIYSSNDKETEFEGYDNLPRILYDNGEVTIAASYYIPEQNGQSSENSSKFLQFSHLSEINPTTATTEDYNFGACQLISPAGVPFTPTLNLFSMYYEPYYNELYDADTRIMTLKVNLNSADIAVFKFDERVMIKNRIYRVNRIDYKPNELATVEFILIP
tara:strand:- start:621 stop:3404 length:2784 start_codon:yes stop_codon:yes gene_type:complete